MLLAALAVSSCTTTETPPSTVASQPAEEVYPALSRRIPSLSDHDQVEWASGKLGQLDPEQENFAKALAHYVSGLIHRSHEEKAAALNDLEVVVALDPTRTELREALAQEYFRDNDYKKAAVMLEAAVKQEPDSIVHWTLLAVAYRADKQWEQAERAANKAIELAPDQFTGYEVLYDVAMEGHHPEVAARILRRAAARESKDSRFWLRLADLTAALGSKEPQLKIPKEDALRYYDKAVSLQPDEAVVLARVADYHISANNLSKAIELYQKALTLQPNAQNIRLKLALAYVGQGDRKQGIQLLEQVVQAEPFRYQVFTIIGELHEEGKEWERAVTSYRLSLGANPNQLMPHMKIVLLQLKNRQSDDALKELDLAQAKFPNTPQVSYFYGLVYSEKKDFAAAVKFFEDALESAKASNPDLLDAVFYFYYGAALERNGQFEKSVTQFLKAIEINPDYADAYNYLGYMYADHNVKLEEGLRLIEQALTYEPDNGAFLDSLGWVHFRLGKLDQALVELQRAAKLIGTDSVVYDHLGDVYRRMGKTAEALHHYQKASELDPKNAELLEKLNQLKKQGSTTSSATSPVSPAQAPSHAPGP